MANLVIGLLQARLGSSRLPGKVLEPVRVSVWENDTTSRDVEVPLLQLMWSRIATSSEVDHWVLCTTTAYVDDRLVNWAKEQGIPCFRGSEMDCLDRFYQAAKISVPRSQQSDTIIVRVTGDCPLLIGSEIDRMVKVFREEKSKNPSVCYAYNASSLNPEDERLTPDGLDVEVFPFNQLEERWKEEVIVAHREHITTGMRRDPKKCVLSDSDWTVRNARWTVDTAEDLDFVREVVTRVSKSNKRSSIDDAMLFRPTLVANLVQEHPDITSANHERGGAAVRIEMDVVNGQAMYTRARRTIPGGTQLLSKRPEMFLPGGWPCYYRRARGYQISDLDGNRFDDVSYNGIGACVLGAADPDVNAAVQRAVELGSMSTLNAPDEVLLAEKLISLHEPWAGGVRYARSGGEAMSIAVRIARAHTGKDVVAVCGYHGWHDWYIAANLNVEQALDGHLLPGLSPAGVPRGLTGSIFTFPFNDLTKITQIVEEHGPEGSNRLAAIVMEPLRSNFPTVAFLEGVRQLADRSGAVLVFDEITVGFRLTVGGAHKLISSGNGGGKYVCPDIAVFGKGMSNGFAMAAIVGRKEVMESAQSTFISSTYWTESIGPAAALACIEKFERLRVHEHLVSIGEQICDVWDQASKDADLPLNVVRGNLALPRFEWKWLSENGRLESPPTDIYRALKTLFTEKMLKRGFLAAPSFYVTFAHSKDLVEKYGSHVLEVFLELSAFVKEAQTLRDTKGVTEAIQYMVSLPKGPLCHSHFARLSE